jgi:putative restriction endonuclease
MSQGIFVQLTGAEQHNPAEIYRFPARCLGAASAMQGGWAIYFEPSTVPDARGCYAMARIHDIVPGDTPSMYLAVLEPSSYLEFSRGVPLAGAVSEPNGSRTLATEHLTGATPPVRTLSRETFESIIERGLRIDDNPPWLEQSPGSKVREKRPAFLFDQPLDPVATYTSRAHRDRLFGMNVLQAYGRRCAFTSALLADAGDAHSYATHILFDAMGGPDGVINGLALTPLMARLFDVGDVGLSNEGRILVSRHAIDSDRICRLINSSKRANLPQRHRDRPHPRFLAWHRENRFKGNPLS